MKSLFLLMRSPLRVYARAVHQELAAVKESSRSNLQKIRNIGIMAHIDAGKTTTTERMLYYSGLINTMGEVHHGNTVTDYMDQERTRGITITSAAVTFNWNGHRINLVDTPGHIDFTMEVEQTLQVLDGAIVVLDASAGVEAQTLTVWRQADCYGIPRIIFLNKMDRRDADLDLCMKSIQSKLGGGIPLLLQLPIRDASDNLIGLVDLIKMEKLLWEKRAAGKQGKEYTTVSLHKSGEEAKLWQMAMDARCSLVERLADLDDTLAEKIIADESLETVCPEILLLALQRATVSRNGVPVLCGSAYRNTGIQPLMDAVVKYLPSPFFVGGPSSSFKSITRCAFGENLCAKAFKIIHHDQKGPLAFVRVYSGKLKKGQKVFNLRLKKTEQSSRLMVAYADDYEEVDQVECGNIAVISGLKEIITGDVVTSSASAANSAKSYLKEVAGMNEEEVNQELVRGANVPEPVFFCSVEPASQAYQNALENALSELEREDPSLRVSHNSDTGQTVLGGMGELHLDIIKERIVSEYKISVDLGPLQIAYKEKPVREHKDSFEYSQKIGSTTNEVKMIISLRQNSKNNPTGGNKKGQLQSFTTSLVLDRSHESAANIAAINFKQLQAIKQGLEFAFSHGPKLGCPVIDTHVILHWFEVRRGTSETVITSSTTQAIQKALKAAETTLMEPVMELEVVLNDADQLQVLLADLSRRRILQQEIEERGSQVVLRALVPLAELLGYSTDLRTLSSGTASFSMEFSCYKEMSAVDEAAAVKSVTGFDFF